uniref:Uncharacterized protein n=1 Tax=Candidatus Kentrum sp. SD TaxID=2126332 RepID=A0A450YGB4_9GAMM|nr:MAG: hypothetical protein BECKSD772F_GA0070984_10077 [Candidatus Kentron sp. SD]VFK40515.1 MAG: hypothetical protein BECKSD772E_GA0070983_10076 [Candidatus Kentron sp. SD]VFK78364.1 MAG: hypothetical protein BECKSD772D_GA0070982_10138 [Candidatus Kentron sp. SD]
MASANSQVETLKPYGSNNTQLGLDIIYFPLSFTNGSNFNGPLLARDYGSLVRGGASLDLTSVFAKTTNMETKFRQTSTGALAVF